ncbi:hypothetical protein AAZX31_03G091900 [Glycine max]
MKLVVTARSVWGAHFTVRLDSSLGLTARLSFTISNWRCGGSSLIIATPSYFLQV